MFGKKMLKCEEEGEIIMIEKDVIKANVKEHIEDAKVKFMSKMSSKVALIVLGAVLIPIIALIAVSVTRTVSTMESTYMSYAQNLAEEAVSGIDFAVDFGEGVYGGYAMDLAENAAATVDIISKYQMNMNAALYGTAVGDIKINGISSSYTYIVDPKGIMLYHPTADKIGNLVENAAVKSIVSDLEAGKKVEPGHIIYNYKGADKLAGFAFTKTGDIVVVTADYDEFMSIDYDTLIGTIEITGVEGSYAYMVSPDGTMLYHKSIEKIGQPVENAAVKGIVANLEAGRKVEPGAVVYDYKGSNKLAGYALTAKGNIVVVTADYDKFIAPVNSLRNGLVVMGVIMTIVFALVGILIVSTMLKSLEKLVPTIRKTAALDFTNDETVEKYSKRGDEIGVIAREIAIMRESLSDIVFKLESTSNNINTNMEDLRAISANVNNMCTMNSDTTEQLAAGMEETSASTTSITGHIGNMQVDSRQIEETTIEGNRMSVEVKERATELRKATEQASKTTINIYNSVKDKSEKAIEASSAVKKINELTDTVMSISSQTGLLALNASIEAARAGEAGRGFSVVASEIGKLADQTSSAVTDINNIVSEVNVAVGSMTDCLRETINFLETNVLDDYRNFESVSVKYQDDADHFKDCMDDIKTGITKLNQTLDIVLSSINEINVTMGEAAEGVSDIAGKTIDMVGETGNTADKVDECKQCVADLNDIIAQFTIK